MKFVDIFINRMGALMVLRCLQVHVSCLDLIFWAEVVYELKSELSPSRPWERSCLLCKSHGSICKMRSTITFHKREDPINPRLVISELGRGQPNVEVAWIEKCTPFCVVPCELTRSHRLESMDSSIQGVEGCHHSICDCRWCLYTGIHSST